MALAVDVAFTYTLTFTLVHTSLWGAVACGHIWRLLLIRSKVFGMLVLLVSWVVGSWLAPYTHVHYTLILSALHHDAWSMREHVSLQEKWQ